ncbi:MAG TPA: hypothetical protein ENK76_05625, partial [Campylobacterales bacterium]|nr:hypothetical protein [Campylobacterales bacterium]
MGGSIMQELRFQVEFLSDIVLLATSNTEGNIENLDFIPGSNFLGMVAKEYQKFLDSFAVFHSGAVRFGDATLLHNAHATYKMPLSFFHEKLDDSKIFNHHLITDFKQFTQLKQKRNGFITESLEEVSIKHNYTQKSAYDKKHRRSKDSSMYGYNAMPKGLIWQFIVKYDKSIDSADVQRIIDNLVGKKRLGKSKSSEYGQVEISEVNNSVSRVKTSNSKEQTLLYVKSRLALVDNEGSATYDLRYLVDGLNEESIVWEKSQLRTSSYTPYNRSMQTKSYERMVINSGSVIVLKNIDNDLIEKIKKGVGVYLSEGFGEILVNPSFLQNEVFSFKKEDKEKKEKKPLTITHDSVKFLQARQDSKEKQLDMAKRVEEFIHKHKSLYKNIKNSQWGTIRSICTSLKQNFEDEIKEYIESGKVTWSEKQTSTLLD